MKRALQSVLILTFIISFATTGYALEISATEQMDHHKMWDKLKRGAVNVLTSPAEIPKQVKAEYAAESTEIGPKVVSTVGGVVKGIAYFGGRLGAGLWDIVTFSLAVPENYEPIMTPEFVFDK